MNHCKEFKCFPVQRNAPSPPLWPGSAQPKTKAWQETGQIPITKLLPPWTRPAWPLSLAQCSGAEPPPHISTHNQLPWSQHSWFPKSQRAPDSCWIHISVCCSRFARKTLLNPSFQIGTGKENCFIAIPLPKLGSGTIHRPTAGRSGQLG